MDDDPPTVPLGDRPAATGADPDRDGPLDTRYRETGRLGAGAMGEVRLCEDRRIGREVALKVARGELRDPSLRGRFLQEARIQAQLEHPSIVPVYDIGRDEAGDPYFTMKRVRGQTLRHVLDALRNGDPAALARYTCRRLLTAFATVCLTVDYAHTREVLHRDLKPANVMLGDYGEIYVLDWGVARSASVREELRTEHGATSPPDEPSPDETAAGDVVGTPGYIAPEQVRGEAVDARADVYALGAILFEILTLERLHSRDPVVALISTLGEVETRPSARAPNQEIPPELDAICTKATAMARADRYPSARALYDAVDGFLEGDRDLERRRQVAVQHTTAAAGLAERAFEASESSAETNHRTRALGEVSRALAFDPSNTEARRVLLRLLTDPPRRLPAVVRDELELQYQARRMRRARGAALLYLLFFFWAPIGIFVVDVRTPWYLAAVALLYAATAAALLRHARLTSHPARAAYGTMALVSLTVSSLSGFAGTMVLVPTVLMANLVGQLLVPGPARRSLVIAMSCGSILLPELLELLGVVPRAYVVEHGRDIIMNRVLDFTPLSHGFIVALTLAIVVAFGVYFSRFRDVLTDAEQRLFVHAWQLRQLLPDTPRAPGRPDGER